ncbi:sigma-70 family RNA polymerase sigma factor [Rhizobium sp. NRK18]|uniref:sigma-70 family RNA polymerase sigma factor n=1 Tax=Rhizobium sp. NRK18 TaxID=2964667 RepID=UPI0029056B8A|nr:sigma-70 family RNA polymerase sigma factor [Rhizobium sp. NRK18]
MRLHITTGSLSKWIEKKRKFLNAVIRLTLAAVTADMQTIVSARATDNRKMPLLSLERGTVLKKRKAQRVTMNEALGEAEGQDLKACLAAVGRDRNVDAFEVLFRHFGPKIRAYMMKRGGNRQLAEELMQETMMMIWKKAEQFDPARGSVSSWIFTIARNVRIDTFRKTNRPEFDPNDPAFVPDDIPPADAIVEAGDEADRLHDAMKKLPAEQVELLRLSFFEEASHSAIAERLNLPLGTVKSRIRLAFARLRDLLGEGR